MFSAMVFISLLERLSLITGRRSFSFRLIYSVIVSLSFFSISHCESSKESLKVRNATGPLACST